VGVLDGTSVVLGVTEADATPLVARTVPFEKAIKRSTTLAKGA